jgi:hypothetical protein
VSHSVSEVLPQLLGYVTRTLLLPAARVTSYEESAHAVPGTCKGHLQQVALLLHINLSTLKLKRQEAIMGQPMTITQSASCPLAA